MLDHCRSLKEASQEKSGQTKLATQKRVVKPTLQFEKEWWILQPTRIVNALYYGDQKKFEKTSLFPPDSLVIFLSLHENFRPTIHSTAKKAKGYKKRKRRRNIALQRLYRKEMSSAFCIAYLSSALYKPISFQLKTAILKDDFKHELRSFKNCTRQDSFVWSLSWGTK